MDDRAQFLHRQFALYNQLLASGVVGKLARKYLGEIATAEEEPAKIDKNSRFKGRLREESGLVHGKSKTGQGAQTAAHD